MLLRPILFTLTNTYYLCSDIISLVFRYIVCRGLKPGSDPVREYMFTVNLKLNHLRNSESDVNEVMPIELIKGDTEFYNHMINSNER